MESSKQQTVEFENEYEITKELYAAWARRPIGAAAVKRLRRWYALQTGGCVLALVLLGAGVFMKEPVFAVIGAVFAAVFMLRLFVLFERANVKRYGEIRAAQTTDEWRRRTSFAQGISVFDANSRTDFEFGDFKQLSEDADWFYLWRDDNLVLRLKKGCFTVGCESDFPDFIKAKIKDAKERADVEYMA